MRRRAEEPIEGLDAMAVGQEKVNQYGRNAVRSLPWVLSFPGESFQTLGATSDPFDLEGPIVGVDKGVSNGLCTTPPNACRTN